MDSQDIVVRLNEAWTAAHSVDRRAISPSLITDAVYEIERLRKIVAEYVPVRQYGTVRPLADIRKEVVLAALEFSHGHPALAARALGIGRTTIYRWLREWGVQT